MGYSYFETCSTIQDLILLMLCGNSGDPGLVGKKFVVAVLDEANQSTEPESLVALHQKVESAVIVGDSRQLDPTAANLECINLGLYYGMHERLQSLGIKPFLLNTQYRMHPFIADFPLRRFYNGEIANGVAADDRPPIKGVPWLNSQVHLGRVVLLCSTMVEQCSIRGRQRVFIIAIF